MRYLRKVLALLVALLILASVPLTALADQQQAADDYAQQLINYYVPHGDDAAAEMECLI